MNEKLYLKQFQKDSFEDIISLFLHTTLKTNRDFKFFVDWQKVKENVDRYKIELNILNSLIGSEAFDNDLARVLTEYPQVLPVIPILIALREHQFRVVRDFMDVVVSYWEFDFSMRSLKDDEVKACVEFFDKTGLKDFFKTLAARSIQDYVTGVEVGLDTNARKNRSGNAMELVVQPILEEIVSRRKDEFHLLFQKKFKHLGKLGLSVPTPLKERKADFILVTKKKDVIDIEVNFYGGTGSKPQEIVDSYINRQNELREYGLHFIWITDGDGWKGQENQITKGFEKVDYLLNLHFCRQGLLESILGEI